MAERRAERREQRPLRGRVGATGRRAWALPAAVAAAVALALVAGAPSAAASQSAPVDTRLFPSRALLPDLLAGARDPAIRGQLVYAWRDPTRFGDGVSGEVALGATLPVLLLAGRPDGDALVVGLEGAAFARFSFEVVERELVDTDWVFAVPLVWRRGAHWLRLRYYHTSSHLGDEYARRFEEQGVNFSRDAVDLTGYARAGRAVGLYALLQWSANVHPEDSKRWLARVGAEVDPWRGRAGRPYGAVDLHVEEDTGWEPRLTAQTGLWLPAIHGRPLRLAFELLTGPTPMGQFHGRVTRQVALGLVWNP